jgi:transcription elongation GreA/GreB family factor
MGHAYSKYDNRYIQTKPKEEEKEEKWVKRLKQARQLKQQRRIPAVGRIESIRELGRLERNALYAEKFMS